MNCSVASSVALVPPAVLPLRLGTFWSCSLLSSPSVLNIPHFSKLHLITRGRSITPKKVVLLSNSRNDHTTTKAHHLETKRSLKSSRPSIAS